ncbi:hypothetical protein [Sporomusa sp.]|uniref:hypothetical protein n=1 Tax=Sporomusa sp. TaxID=2078658 RepID=UPI002C04ED8D|nr:hypothetical protein [Sporomusa sp.]HWR07614.1 hypothetical protein [Sporomusa sp.]
MSTVIASFYNFGVSPVAGRVRLISSTGATPAVVSGSGVNLATTDPVAFYFNGGNSTGIRVLVVERRYNVSFVQIFCFLSVYDPSTWTQTVAPNTTAYQYSDSTDLLNIYNLNSPGGANAGTLFGADYSAGRVFKLIHAKPSTTETLTLASDYYQFTATGAAAISAGATAYSVDTVFNTETPINYIYAVAQQYVVSPAGSSNPNDYTYFPSVIVKLNASNLAASPVDGPDATIAPNVFELQFYVDRLYTTALGGPQWNSTPIVWNEASKIQRVALANLAVTDLVRPSTVAEASTDDEFDIRSLAILSNGDVYILAGSYDGSFALSGRLWATTISDLDAASDDLISNVSGATIAVNISTVFGYLWAALPANDISKVWGMLGVDLGIYDAGGIVTGTSAISAGTASEWTTGSPSFNAVALAMPSITRLKGAAPASIKSVRGFVHPLLASRAGVKPEDFDKFVNSYLGK